jgi:non-heme chloroperoxidase
MATAVRRARLSSGLTLPYVEQGDPGGLPVLLLHGYVESWRSFELVLPHLPPWLRALAVTGRGHGDADRPAGGYGLDELSADAAAFMDAVGLEAAVIVGGSSGGLIAQRLAVDHPERALGLVLVGSPRSLRGNAAVAAFADALCGLRDPIEDEFARDFVASTLSRPVPADFLETMIGEARRAPAAVWRQTLQGLLEAPPPTEAGPIAAPTLILWGDRDRFLPRAEQEALAAAVAGARLVVYEGAGHVLHWEEPERVAADVAALAARAAAGAGPA